MTSLRGGSMAPSSRDILLIEDSEADRVLIGAMLAERPDNEWRVVARGTLAEGLGLLRLSDPASPFAAVLLDLSLPDSHGLQTCDSVRQLAPWLPIVVLTGHDNDETALEAVHLGAQDYLCKNSLTGDLLR